MNLTKSESKLDELAWLSLTKPDSAKIEDFGLTQDEVREACDFSNSRLSFRNPEEAKTRAIRHIQSAIIAPSDKNPPALFEALQRCWLSSGPARKDNLGGLALAKLHNSSVIDALQIAIEAIQSGGNAFAVSRVIAESLPYFDQVDVPNLLILVGLVGPQGFLQYAAGEWMKGHPSSIDGVAEGCLAIPSEALAPLLRTALIQGVAADRAPWLARVHELVADPNQLVSLPAVEALGLLDWSGAEAQDIDRAVKVIRAGLQSDDTHQLVAAIGAGLNLVSTAADRHILIDEIAALDKPYVVRQIGDHLAYRDEHLKSQPWYLEKISFLATRTEQEGGSYHGVDHILADLYRSSEKTTCLEWLETWAAANSSSTPSLPEELPELFEILAQDDEALGTLIARWLTHDDLGIQKIVRDVLDNLGLRERGGLAFPTLLLNTMTSSGLLHLVRRVLANVLREEQKISLIWSLTRTDSAESRTYSLVRGAMVDFVGYDYPMATEEHLEAVVAKEGEAPIGKLAKQILEAMKAYYDALTPLLTIEELQPLSEHRRRFAQEHHRQMNAAFEEASKNSIIRQIATTIHLKAGRSSFSMRNGEVSEKMHMSSASHSMAIPRSELIDKVGSDLRRRHFMFGKEPREQ